MSLPKGIVYGKERHMKKPIIAIMYDFDQTLSKSDMQDYGFIPSLGMKPDEFWEATGKFSAESGVERILSYMWMMAYLSKEKGIHLTRKTLNDMGKNIEFFPGVDTWFKRINKYGKDHGVKIEHYIISSGTKEIVEGCSIAKEFAAIYGCEFYFDPKTEEPIWPKLSINYTQKTQYIYRISKGVLDVHDDKSINEKDKEHRIPYENMIYLGDGMTDVPCMQLVKNNGGRSIAIYGKRDKENMRKLLAGKRVNYAASGDYREGKTLDKAIKAIIDNIASSAKLHAEEQQLLKKEAIE